MPISHIADTVGISRRFIYKWVKRFLAEGLEGLVDKPRRGAQPGQRTEDLQAWDEVADTMRHAMTRP